MFDCLAVEGWRVSTLLPQGWMLKIPAPEVINFLNKEGVFLDSFEKMHAHIDGKGQITKQEMHNLSTLESKINEFYVIHSRSNEINEADKGHTNQSEVSETGLNQSLVIHQTEPNISEKLKTNKNKIKYFFKIHMDRALVNTTWFFPSCLYSQDMVEVI